MGRPCVCVCVCFITRLQRHALVLRRGSKGAPDEAGDMEWDLVVAVVLRGVAGVPGSKAGVGRVAKRRRFRFGS
jgi:hypothetical protein